MTRVWSRLHTIQGIGWALSEEYSMRDEGRTLNTSLQDYRIQ